MEKTLDSINMLPTECVKTVNLYASMIHRYRVLGSEHKAELEMKKLRDYLTCLRYFGVLTQIGLMNLYLWVTTGHTVGIEAGKIV